MSKITRIQNWLLQKHPELQQKHTAIRYFQSLDFPNKQRDLICWWNSILEEAIILSNQVYLSPSDLELIFTIHRLKPVSLRKILRNGRECGKFQLRDCDALEESKSSVKRLVLSICSAIFPQKSIKAEKLRSSSLQKETSSKVISMNYLSICLSKVKDCLEQIFDSSESNCILHSKAMKKISQKLDLSSQALEFLVLELEQKMWIKCDMLNGATLIIYSPQPGKYLDSKWIEFTKQKYVLIETIHSLNAKINKYQKEQEQKTKSVKQLLESGDHQNSRKILEEINKKKKLIEIIEIREKTLTNQLNQLLANENNVVTIQVLEATHKLIKAMPVDEVKLDEIREQALELQARQKQINEGFQKLSEMRSEEMDIDMEIEEMMDELEQDISRKRTKVIKQQIKMKLEKITAQEKEQPNLETI